MTSFQSELKKLPGVDKLLNVPEIKTLEGLYGKNLTAYAVRSVIDDFRSLILSGQSLPPQNQIIDKIVSLAHSIGNRSLKPVINASGIIVHTNLGRAPFGAEMLEKVFPVLKGYNNLEFNLNTGERGDRNLHASEILKFITRAEDVVVVNNNAAAVMLILRAFARKKEVIVSRGELIEIGGSFRIPDIMAASDCKMVEVGTTNKTKIADFEKALSPKTALLFKAHKSNYVIKGFTQEASLEELVTLGKKHNIPVVYDIGSGLIRKTSEKALKDEPDVKQALSSGIDLICFSGDKLLGGPQAGIIAGKKEYIAKLKSNPMLRALRVCKTTIAFLEAACLLYLNDEDLFSKNPSFKFMKRQEKELLSLAGYLKEMFDRNGLKSETVKSDGQYGGGTLPDMTIPSYSVKIIYKGSNKTREIFAEKMYHELLQNQSPVLSILKKGELYFDVLTLTEDEIPIVGKIVSDTYKIIAAQLKEMEAKA
ncbi:MAG: L-seryl-tRNA(Sec) selenium transferase [Bacteroidetes bacterium GWF2_38_335]|nr:MAG: L-seryl-tRNA(Sec) selenium transferase [Bacteroidetes bacterium GWF2_38_335]OFY81416.1 MAG: L-seryl-tRNA(Sec) selenium transferase [Bacteroidetes bacterium RIFOXYA12_FULL_38_20]HBS85543.1 L-seryl-tRNA(Sec) selenium transferase [Bacteroidales bacterium]